MSLFHPSIRLPLWAAIALPAAAYAARSVIRGFDFTPDLPNDVVVFGLLAVAVIVVGLVRRGASNSGDDHLTGEMQAEDEEAEEAGQ